MTATLHGTWTGPGRSATWPAPAAAPAAVNPVVRGALYLFVLSIPFEIPHRTIPIEIPTLAGFLFLFTTVLNPSACYRRIPAPLLWFAVHVWILVAATVVNDVEQRQLVVWGLLGLTQVLLLFWAMYNLFADPGVLRGALLAIAWTCVARAAVQVLGIAATSHAVWTGGERVTAFGQNANQSAMVLSAGLAAVVGLTMGAAAPLARLRLVGWPMAGLIGVAIVQTGSRGGLLCALAALAVLMFRGASLAQRVRNAVLAIAAVGLLGAYAFNSPMMRNRLEAAAEEGNLAGRERIYPALISMYPEHPLLGWGSIANQYEVARRIGERQRAKRDAHNLLLELLTTSGIIGTVPFLIGLALCIRGAVRGRHGPLGALPLAMLAAVLTATVSGTWMEAKVLWLSLAFALAAGTHWRSPAPVRGAA